MIDKVIDLVGLSSLWTETGIQTENKYTTESLESEATRDFKNENKREFDILMFINIKKRLPVARFNQNDDIWTFKSQLAKVVRLWSRENAK